MTVFIHICYIILCCHSLYTSVVGNSLARVEHLKSEKEKTICKLIILLAHLKREKAGRYIGSARVEPAGN